MLDHLVVIRGAGDLASGVAYRLAVSGFPVVMTEIAQPTVVRRTVSFAQAVFDGECLVEGVQGRLVQNAAQARAVAMRGGVAVLVDPPAACVCSLSPDVVVDAIMAKRNLGTAMSDAPVVVAIGQGFRAAVDVHAVVETNRGHWLGRVILTGEAQPDTGVPATVDGHGVERVLRAPADGALVPETAIGDTVSTGDVVCRVDGQEVLAPFKGCLRGLIQRGVPVSAGMKIGDVDPRATRQHCFTISDKALAIAGGVLEAVMYFLHRQGQPVLSYEPCRPLAVPRPLR